MIHVEGIGKRYQLGVVRHDTLWDTITHRAKGLFRGAGAVPENGDEDHFWALKDVSFDVGEGEVVGIIGRNGAGKSTLLKILSRITPPTEGRIRLKGRVASLLEVGTGFHHELSGRENIFLNGAILGMSRREIKAKFDEIVAFSEVEKFIDTPVKHYSSGMYVRLAFAVAAHLEPEILVVDEVLAVGDAAFQRKCLGKMGSVARGGRTVLFVSHNMAAVENLCQRVLFFAEGRLVEDGESAEVIGRYLSQLHPGFGGGLAYNVSRQMLDDAKSGDVALSDIELFDLDYQPLKVLGTGEGFVLRIHYTSSKQVGSPVFGVRIKGEIGQDVLHLNTRPISGYDIKRLYERGYIDLVVDQFPVTSGRYYLDVGIARERREWLVLLEEVVALEVSEKDVYGSGKALDNNRGLIVVPHHWNHESCGAAAACSDSKEKT